MESSLLDQEQVQYHEIDKVEISCEVTELAVSSSLDPPPVYASTEIFGSWAQYDQVQYESTTVLQSTQTVTDQTSGQYYAYPAHESQGQELYGSLLAADATQYAVSSATAQTYQVAVQLDTNQTFSTPSVPATTAPDNTASFTGYASVPGQQTAETAYMVPVPVSPQGLPGQPFYMTQTVTNNQNESVPSTPTTWQPSQPQMLGQVQYAVQGSAQFNSTPYQSLHVSQDGQYYVQVPLSQPVQAPQPIAYQTGPDGVQCTTASPTSPDQTATQPQPQSPSSGRKLWRRETASQAKEVTIAATKKAYGKSKDFIANKDGASVAATKKAYDKSKEFIVNKDGARAVAKTTWRQSRDVVVKTTDVLDKFVKPLMPLIAIADPDVAAALKVTSTVGGVVRSQDRKQKQAQLAQAQQAQAQPPQLDAAALANLAPLLALLQQPGQLNAASGSQQGYDPQVQARLLAALLQVQQQQPHIQQPQIQQPESQQQQPQHHQVSQPASQQQQQSPPQSPYGQVQQPQIPQPANQQSYVQQPSIPSPPQTQIQQQVAQQPHPWQQPAQQSILQQQPQQRIPRRKPVSSNPALQQPAGTSAPPASSPTLQPNPEQLTSLVDAQLTLQELPKTHSQPQTSLPEAWTQHALPAFGIESILLPPGVDPIPSQNTAIIAKLLPEADFFLEIEPFATSALLQGRINTLQSIPMTASETQLLELLAVRPELNPASLVAADCLVSLSAGQQISYTVLLQSSAPQGYGILISSTTGAAATQAAKEAVRRVAGSVRWASPALVGDGFN